MLKSMTGFGKAEVKCNSKKIIVEIRSLNSKQLDISTFRLPSLYRDKEHEIRNILSQQLVRGKVDCYINFEEEIATSTPEINKATFRAYLEQINTISRETGIEFDSTQTLAAILKLPEVLKTDRKDVPNDEWQSLFEAINSAINNLNTFRVQEGKATAFDLVEKVKTIKDLLNAVAPFEAERINTIRQKLMDGFARYGDEVKPNPERLEQELIFYIERLDINEEKVRLANHCHFFIETISLQEPMGRKLGFIAQEMGREINTLGSKANHTEIQKIVVQMKDELEKIKEQLLNIL
jgi:uncharacterized protein (TIGR00255 family)